jgi:hypothetical protein
VGTSESAAVVDLLGFLELPVAAAAVEELFLLITTARERQSLQKRNLGCVTMAAGYSEEDDGGDGIGKKALRFFLLSGAIRIARLS